MSQMSDRPGYKSINEYIAIHSADIQERLNQLHALITELAPHAVESISYGMPAFKLNGKPLVYFAAYPNHIGFYPIPSGMTAFEKELSVYKQGKGSVQFPLDQPLPLDLIRKIVAFRVEENQSKKTGG